MTVGDEPLLPGCLLLLVQRSASMARPLSTAARCPKLTAALGMVNGLLALLVRAHEAGRLRPLQLDLAVLGYHTDDRGQFVLTTLLGKRGGTQPFVPLEAFCRQAPA